MDWTQLAGQAGVGLAIGLALAVPVGPVNLICVRRTLALGLRPGLATGLGAALADTIYGVMAVFGVSYAMQLVANHPVLFHAVAVVILLISGLAILAAGPATTTGSGASQTTGFATAFVLTLSNPLPLLSLGAALTALGLPLQTFEAPLVTAVGVALGSALWWVTLASGIALLRSRCEASSLAVANRWIGALLLLLAVAALFRF